MRMLLAAVMAVASPAAAEPGRLIAAVPFAAPGLPAGAKAWRVTYETRDVAGAPTQSTGMVFAPAGDAADRPVVAWAHGTVGIVPACQPSTMAGGLEQIPDLAGQLRRGWVVAATDYPGLGTPGPHAYLVGDATGRAVLDSVRAARAVRGAGAGARFAVWGHSQGAHAAIWTGLLATTYAPELTPVGMAAASPPTDIAANFAAADPLARGILSAYIVRSWNRVYGAPMAAVADARTVGIIERATNGCVGNKVGLPQLIRLFALKGRMGRVDLAAAQSWADLVRRNSPDPVALVVPHFVVSSRGDKLVADAVTRSWVRRACAVGEAVTLETTAEPDHNLTARASAPTAMRWIADRFAGRAATGCSGA